MKSHLTYTSLGTYEYHCQFLRAKHPIVITLPAIIIFTPRHKLDREQLLILHIIFFHDKYKKRGVPAPFSVHLDGVQIHQLSNSAPRISQARQPPDSPKATRRYFGGTIQVLGSPGANHREITGRGKRKKNLRSFLARSLLPSCRSSSL